MSGTYRSTIRLTRSGMTLLEIMVAMMVLLVGIYAVARGFPTMLHSVRGEGERTSMARLAEETMARLTGNQYGLPDAITGGGSIAPESFPEDPIELHTTASRANAQEDMLEVRGETFRVPVPYRGPGSGAGTPARYVLNVGPTQVVTGGYPYVYMLVPLQERPDDPSGGGPSDAANWFYPREQDAQVVVPSAVMTTEGGATRTWSVSGVVVDYAWTPGTLGAGLTTAHYVQSEFVPPLLFSSGSTAFAVSGGEATATVHPKTLAGGCRLVPGQTRAWARVEFARENFGTYTPSDSGRFAVNQFGTTLALHPRDAGLTLKVDYQLRNFEGAGTDENGNDIIPRRELLMIEDRVIERSVDRTATDGTEFTDIRLAMKGIEEDALFSDPDADDASTNAAGNAVGTEQVHVLAVDLLTGYTYYDGDGIVALEDINLEPPLEAGFQDGVVTLPLTDGSGNPQPYLGHTWRFYYKTTQRHSLQVQKAPRAYVDSATAESYLEDNAGVDQSTEVDFRTYMLHHRAFGANRSIGVLEFGQWLANSDGSGTWAPAESNSGQTVAVNYAYSPTANTREYVWGELHTVKLHTVSPGLVVALNHATWDTRPIEVLAVNGVSVRARGWWLALNGRQRQLAIETVLMPKALGILPRVR